VSGVGGGLAVLLIVTSAHAAVLRVDPEATGTPIDGDTWPTAYRDLQSALAAANHNDEIWVANGEYVPTFEYTTNQPLSVTFLIDRRLTIYGGFEGGSRSGGGETEAAQRDPVANPTILSGDLGSSRAWHVVRFEGDADEFTQLDGFIIEKGEAGSSAGRGGGGILVDGRPVIVSNCIVRDCSASLAGGGVVLYVSIDGDLTPTFVNVTIVDNQSGSSGGGVAIFAPISGAEPTFVNCVIARNTAGGNGGGVANLPPSIFGTGRGCAFINCTIVDNSVPSSGTGGGIYTTSPNADDANRTDVRNSILWGNRVGTTTDQAAQFSYTTLAGVSVQYSCIEDLNVTGPLGGPTNMNIGDDPDFVDFNGGDYRIAVDSPAADAGLNSALPPDVADLNRDGILNPTTPRDRLLLPRIGRSALAPYSNPCATSRVDMGAFETFDCDGDGDPDTGLVDTNGDGIADACQDCNGTGAVDPIEIAEGTQFDCNGNGIPDDCEIASGCVEDLNNSGIPDMCECLIDLVFIVDTSGSVLNEASAVCAFMNSVSSTLGRAGRLAREPLRLGIHDVDEFAAYLLCLHPPFAVTEVYGAEVPIYDTKSLYDQDTIDHDEDWGGATAVVAERHQWISNNRYIVILSDEGAQDGGPADNTDCNSSAPDGADYLAVLNATGICLNNSVIVFPVGTPGFDAINTCVEELLDQMADGTGGLWYGATSTNPLSAIAEEIVEDMIDTTLGCPGGDRGCVGDLNDDCVVDGADLGALLAQWGSNGPADLNGDGQVDGADLGALLAAWGACDDCESFMSPGDPDPIDPASAGFTTFSELLHWIQTGAWHTIAEWLSELLASQGGSE